MKFTANLKKLFQVILIIKCVISCSVSLLAQKVPASNAIQLSDSLRFVTASANGQTSVVFHPVFQKYYSLRGGNKSFPMETWSVNGTPLAQDTAGIDSRGVWYNPNTGQVERNCFSSLGWATVGLNASGNATGSSFTMLFSGMKQPNVQSVGAYDFKTNTVLFNNSGVISVYDRNTGILSGTINLSGTSLANINIYSVIYTGETGFEIGILDFVAKTVLLFNRSTGVFSGMSQLPANAVTHNQFRFSYANNRVWLFNASTRTWNSFNIWQQTLPVELITFAAKSESNNNVHCSWSTASESNNAYFIVERSSDGIKYEGVGSINGAGNSKDQSDYFLNDEIPLPGVSYYRLKQVDFNGDYTYSKVIQVVNEKAVKAEFLVFPNPAHNVVTLEFEDQKTQSSQVEIYNVEGKKVFQESVPTEKGQNSKMIDISNISKGIYFIEITTADSRNQIRLVKE